MIKNKVKPVTGVQLPKPRSGFAAVKGRDNRLYVCGGNTGSVLRRLDCFNLKTGKWLRLADMKFRRDELAVTLGPDSKIYAIGGYGGADNSCLNTAERYDPLK